MKRRTLLVGMLSAAAWPLAAGAQSRTAVVGFLTPGTLDSADRLATFKDAMRGLGYAEGQNLEIEVRTGNNEPNSLTRLANDLVKRKVDVIVAWLTPTVRAARQATAEIPIVMAGAGDPVAIGLVASLGRPGGNITGMAAVTPELAGKNIELIRELLPSARKLSALCNENDAFTRVFLEQVRAASEKANFELDTVMTNAHDVEAAFRRIRSDHADTVIVQPSLPARLCARLALDAGLPAISPIEIFARAGGLMGYAGRSDDQFREAAIYVDKILKGSKPADLPIQLPTRFDLSINLKTAQALGLTIPQAILARADNVIE